MRLADLSVFGKNTKPCTYFLGPASPIFAGGLLMLMVKSAGLIFFGGEAEK